MASRISSFQPPHSVPASQGGAQDKHATDAAPRGGGMGLPNGTGESVEPAWTASQAGNKPGSDAPTSAFYHATSLILLSAFMTRCAGIPTGSQYSNAAGHEPVGGGAGQALDALPDRAARPGRHSQTAGG